MSISSAILTARSGLVATEKWAQTTSENIANAGREGYVRRGVSLSARAGGTVEITGISRDVDASLDRMHRGEVSRIARQETLATSLEAHAAHLGEPGDASSLSGRLTDLQGAFDLLYNDPGNEAAQRGVLDAAEALSGELNGASESLDRVRHDNERGIAADVATVNDALERLSDLNGQIALEGGATARRAALQDEVAQELDALSEIADLRISLDVTGRTNVHFSGGAALLEGTTVQTLTYDAATGRLDAGGVDVTPGTQGARGFSEGRLAARFDLKTQVLPRMGMQLDEFARVLVEGFEQADASLGAGQAGLFTDAGAAFDGGGVAELAARITVNDLARPEAGGQLSRLRDGMGATGPGVDGDPSQIGAFAAVLDQPQTFDAGAGLGAEVAVSDYVTNLIADQQLVRTTALDRRDTIAAGAEAIEAARMNLQGVNVDDELQQLMMIEQSYAANAQMMTALGRMLDTLIEAV